MMGTYQRPEWEIEKNRKRRQMFCLGTALVLALLLTGYLLWQRGLLVEARQEAAKERLAEEVLRFHVLANSDSDEDQRLKLKVKEAVLSYMEKDMPKAEGEEGVEAVKTWVTEHSRELEMLAEATLAAEGCYDKAEAELVRDYFPEKTYGDVRFPAGEYEALRIKIGKAQGHNWWCCLYPKLCFVTAVHAVVPEEEKEELGCVLGEDEYDMITASSGFKIKWFFFGGDSEKEE